MSLSANEIVTFADLLDMVNNEGYSQKTTITSSNEAATKSEILAAINANITGGDSMASNELVNYGAIRKSLEVSLADSLSPSSSSNSYTFDIVCQVSWSSSLSEPWISLSPTSGTGSTSGVVVTIAENSSATSRTGTMTLSDSYGNAYTVTFTQAAADPTPFSALLGSGSTSLLACNKYSSDPSTYYLDTEHIATASEIYTDSAGTSTAASGWYSNGSTVRYWDGSAFTSTTNCS